MKREFLEGLGLEKESVDKIMAENGADLEREKAKTTAAKADLADAQGKLTAAQTELDGLKKAGSDIAAVQKQLTDLQAKYDKDTGDLKGQLADRDYSDAITRAITGKALKFSSKSAERAFTAALKEKKLELNLIMPRWLKRSMPIAWTSMPTWQRRSWRTRTPGTKAAKSWRGTMSM